MRLLKYSSSGKLELTDDLEHDIPEYAILSHTWSQAKPPEKEEFTYQDLIRDTGKEKPGYAKIKFCAAQTQRDSLQYFWIDTCYIDKSDTAELNKAMDNMFSWYQNAARCYVHLSDVPSFGYNEDSQQSEFVWKSAFRKCRWFSRGWTLQELLAPTSVEFFANDSRQLGDKRSLEQEIHKITGIDIEALRGADLARFSIKDRFSWADPRSTTRGEDWAYCLQGIFGVSMPITYGEGKENAISRLHQEINKTEAQNQEYTARLGKTDPQLDKKRIEQTKGGLLRDSYKWILQHQDFKRWRDNDQSQLLWIKGDPGKGKTMLLCGIIDEISSYMLRDSIRPYTALSYFFYQATDPRLNNATAILRGLIYLLISRQPSFLFYIRKKCKDSGKNLFEDINAWLALSETFTEILKDSSLGTTYLVIDALDEYVNNRPKLLDFILESSKAIPTVKWIVSSRNWTEIEKKLGKADNQARLSLELNKEAVSSAVASYIDFKIRGLSEENNYDTSTEKAVRSYLISNADGTFLWVALVCQQLAETSAWEVEEVLAVFPPGLNSLYQQMIGHIRSSRHHQLCQQILAALSVMQRPITIDELTVLVEIPSKARGNYKALAEIIGHCGSFLTVYNRTIFFIHQSAKDFLLGKEISAQVYASGSAQEYEKILSRSIKSMSQELRRNIYCLRHPGILIEQVRQPQPDPLAAIGYSCYYWVDHLLESESNAWLQDEGLVDQFLRQNYLYWLETLSLLQSIPQAARALGKLRDKLHYQQPTSALLLLVQDMQRFLAYNQWPIENSPLQVYTSALIFTPNNSLTKKVFKREKPKWLEIMPKVEDNWNPCLQTLEGHSHSVWSVTFSGDRQRLASGSGDKTIRIWDPATGQCLQTLEGHSDSVLSVAFSGDGQRLASGSYDKTIRIWDPATGQCLQTLEGHSDSVLSVAFSGDRQRLASGSDDNTIRIWDLATGQCLQLLEVNSVWVSSVAFSGDGQRLALGSHDNTIRIWDLATGQCFQTLAGHSDSVWSVAFSGDGQRLASGSADKTIRI